MRRHLALGDYFHNLAWKLGVLEEDLRESLARHDLIRMKAALLPQLGAKPGRYRTWLTSATGIDDTTARRAFARSMAHRLTASA